MYSFLLPANLYLSCNSVMLQQNPGKIQLVASGKKEKEKLEEEAEKRGITREKVKDRMEILGMTTFMQSNKDLQAFVHDVANKLAVPAAQILILPWCNFLVPQLYNALERKLMCEITGLCLNSNPSSVGLVSHLSTCRDLARYGS